MWTRPAPGSPPIEHRRPQAAVKAGIPMSVPSININKVCLSGIDAIALADQLIRAGEFDIVSDDYRQITGHPARLLREFFEEVRLSVLRS